MFYGYPATKSSGYFKKTPNYSKYVAPYGKFGKFGKCPYGKCPYGFGKGFGKGFGYPATKSGGYSSVVPATTVVTSPFPI